jgi:hypothetical protein
MRNQFKRSRYGFDGIGPFRGLRAGRTPEASSKCHRSSEAQVLALPDVPNCGIQTFELCREERPGGRLKLVASEDVAPRRCSG